MPPPSPPPSEARSPNDERVRAEFEALFASTAGRLERLVALVVIVTGLVALLVLGLGTEFGIGLGRGARFTAFAFLAWYGLVLGLIRAGLYRPWLRYLSSFVDISLASLVYVTDASTHGWLFSVSAAGPMLYMLAVGAAALRLDPRLCLYAGTLATAQFVVATTFLVLPEADPAHEALLRTAWLVTLTRASFIFALGTFGGVATRSMRGLLFRLTWSAVERERVRGLFGVYVSEEIVDVIIAGGLRAGGDRRSVTVVFSDIRDFTRLSEAKPPEEVLLLLNLYFDRMCRIVARHGGLVNKFLGDGMLIVFGAPAETADDAGRALACAQEMVAESALMSESGAFPGLRIGVGLHRGETVLGSVGGSQRQEYTVIGDTVNTASRVQDLTKAIGRPILLTAAMRDALGAVPLEALGSHPVKGREALIELFAPRDAATEQKIA
jgi:adenylate cyclase